MSMITVSLDANIFSEGLDWSAFKVDQAAVREYQRLEEVSKSLPELM